MTNYTLKSDVREQFGSENLTMRNKSDFQHQPNSAPPPVEVTNTNGTVENYPQWELPKNRHYNVLIVIVVSL